MHNLPNLYRPSFGNICDLFQAFSSSAFIEHNFLSLTDPNHSNKLIGLQQVHDVAQKILSYTRFNSVLNSSPNRLEITLNCPVLDFLIVTKNGLIKINKKLLLRESPFIQALCRSGMQEQQNSTLNWKNYSLEAVELLIEFASTNPPLDLRNHGKKDEVVRELIQLIRIYAFDRLRKRIDPMICTYLQTNSKAVFENVEDWLTLILPYVGDKKEFYAKQWLYQITFFLLQKAEISFSTSILPGLYSIPMDAYLNPFLHDLWDILPVFTVLQSDFTNLKKSGFDYLNEICQVRRFSFSINLLCFTKADRDLANQITHHSLIGVKFLLSKSHFSLMHEIVKLYIFIKANISGLDEDIPCELIITVGDPKKRAALSALFSPSEAILWSIYFNPFKNELIFSKLNTLKIDLLTVLAENASHLSKDWVACAYDDCSVFFDKNVQKKYIITKSLPPVMGISDLYETLVCERGLKLEWFFNHESSAICGSKSEVENFLTYLKAFEYYLTSQLSALPYQNSKVIQ